MDYYKIEKLLSAEKWDEVIAECNSCLSTEPEEPEIYQTLLLAEAKVKNFTELKYITTPIDNCPSYRKAIACATPKVKDYIISCNKTAIYLPNKRSLSNKSISNKELRINKKILTVVFALLFAVIIIVGLYTIRSYKIKNEINLIQEELRRIEHRIAEIDDRGRVYDNYFRACDEYENGRMSENLLDYYTNETAEMYDLETYKIYYGLRKSFDQELIKKRQNEISEALELINKKASLTLELGSLESQY